MSSRRTFAKVGAFVAGTSLAALAMGAAPASADQAEGRIGNSENGYNVDLGQGFSNMRTTLFNLDLEGGNSFKAYCVEISVSVDPSRSLFESPWDEFPNPDSPFHKNRDKINWVLHHGYPAQDLDALSETLADEGVDLHNGLDRNEAIAGTQAAVWHFSDGKDLNRDNPLPRQGSDADADVLALYDYLTGESNVGVGEQPTPALELAPKTLSGEAGDRLGPFTVTTTGEVTDLTSELPEGVTLTDADGNELTAGDVTSGTDLYVDVPEDAEEGDGAFSVSATAHLSTGRLFVSEGYDRDPAQSLIVAASEDTTLKATAGAEWTAAPVPTEPEQPTTEPSTPSSPSQPAAPTETTETPVQPQADSDDLAQTGFSALTPLLIGVGLVGVGAGAILLQRRRKNAA